MRKAFFISFFILGLTSIIAQLVVIRESIISFYGNELFIGLVLGFWLIWVAIGSISLAKRFNKKNPVKILIFCHFFTPFIFLAEIVLLRLARQILVNPGQTPDLFLSIGYLILTTAPLGLFLGLQFTQASRSVIREQKQTKTFRRLVGWLKDKFLPKREKTVTYLVSQGYFYETLGLVIGGLLFSFIFVFFDSLSLFFLLASINLGIIILLLTGKRARFLVITLLILIISSWLISDVTDYFVQITNSWRFIPQDLIATTNSKFGNIAITQTGKQYNFYETGLLIGSTEETFFNEELIHLSLLYHLKPKRILLIGGGFNGAINEILKYPVEKVYYLELDPQLISAVKPYLPAWFLASLDDPKVSLIFEDALYFIKNTNQKFDVVIINLPNPATALLNRFYTVEFFGQVKEKLNENGILVTHLTSLANYFSPELEDLSTSIYKSLKEDYASVIVLPEDNLLYLASDSELNYNSWPLLNRFDQYGLVNQLVTKDYLYYRLTNDRISQGLNTFKENETAEINTNRRPVGYWYQNLFWLSSQHPKLTKFLSFFSQIKLGEIIIFSIIMFFVIFYSLEVLVKKKERILATLTIIPEFSLLAVEIVFIFLFQTIYGYLYYQLSLIFAVILLGIGVGTWLANFLVAFAKVKYAYLIRLYFCLSLYFLFLALLVTFVPKALEIPIVFYWLVFIAGFLAGMEFPWANKFYLQLKLDPDKKTGIIYGADLIGSSLGAILTSIFFLPILGFAKTIIFLALLNFLAFVALFFLRQNFEEG